MSKPEERDHGVAVCESCDSIQPVEIGADGDVRTVGNPSCSCGSNEFRLVDH